MARRPKFNLNDIFRHLDAMETGVLSHECFKRVFATNKYYPSDHELNLLFSRFDRHKTGRVHFQQFTDEIMPKNTLCR